MIKLCKNVSLHDYEFSCCMVIKDVMFVPNPFDQDAEELEIVRRVWLPKEVYDILKANMRSSWLKTHVDSDVPHNYQAVRQSLNNAKNILTGVK